MVEHENLWGDSGVSLSEIIMVVAILSLLATLGAPAIENFCQQQRVHSSLRNIATLLMNARFAALKTHSQTVVEFSEKTCRSFIDNGKSAKDWIYQQDEKIIDEFSVEPGLSLTTNCNKSSHPNKFLYTRHSRVSPCSITVAKGEKEQGKVVINSVGRVRIEIF